MKPYHLQVNGWNWRTSFLARSAKLVRPKIVCFPSYADFRSRANSVMWLAWDHKGRAHMGDIKIGRKPKTWKRLISPLQRS
jgi:hypothetical protein